MKSLNLVFGLFENPINAWFFSIIICSFVWFLVIEVVSLRRLKRGVRGSRFYVVRKVISYLEKRLKDSASSDHTSLLLEKQQHKIENNVWRALTEHLKGNYGEKEDVFFADTKNKRFVLIQYPSQLLKVCPPSSLRFGPAFLTALGVLGTFLGIFIGLQNVNIENIDKPGQLLSSSIQLLDGMKVAFGTSLVGLTCASLFMLILSVTSSQRSKVHRNLRKKLDSLAYYETPSHLLWRLNPEDTRKSAEALREVAKSFNPQIIGKAVSTGINYSIRENLVPVFEGIREELANLKNIKTDQGEKIIERLVQELDQRLVAPFVKRLDETTGLVKEFSVKVNKLSEEIGRVTESISSMVITTKDFQEGTLGRMEAFTTDLKTSLMEFSEDSKNSFREMSDNIQNAVEVSTEGMEKQRVAFEISAEKASDTFRGIREDLEKALQSQTMEQQRMLQEVRNNTEAILEKAKDSFREQSNTLEVVGQEASKLMEEAKENLLQGLKDIGGVLHEIREKGTDELKRFMSSYQTSLEAFLEEQNKSLEEVIGRQREGLSTVIEQLQSVFREEIEKRSVLSKEVDQSMLKVKDAAQEVGNLVDTVGLSSSARIEQLQLLSRDIGKQVEKVDRSYKEVVQRLHGSLELVEKNHENLSDHFRKCLIDADKNLTEYFKKAENSYGNFFKEADTATEKLCTKLYEMAAFLVTAEDHRRIEKEELT